jgi:hypothetical protein
MGAPWTYLDDPETGWSMEANGRYSEPTEAERILFRAALSTVADDRKRVASAWKTASDAAQRGR